MSFTVQVSNLFHSKVYHVFTDNDAIRFLIYDPFHKRFDVVEAEMCQPMDHITQPYEIQKKILQKLQKDRDLEVFRTDKAKQEYREQRREAKQKG